MAVKSFSEHTPGVQWTTLVAIVGFFTGSFGAIALWAADQKINEKYATDEDLAAVQHSIEDAVSRLTESINQNTDAVTMTAETVDGLALTVLDLQITRVAEEIAIAEAEQRDSPASFTSVDAAALRQRQQALADLRTRREALYRRIFTP